MTRHVAVLLAALALIAGACSGSEPVASESSSAAVSEATPTPAPTATVTPTRQPTATAAPTSTPAPSDEELAVIAAWERYVVLSAQARSNDPSPEALDFGSYVMDGALDATLGAIEGDRNEGRYILGRVETTVTDFTFRPDGEVIVEACVTTEYSAHSVDDNSVILTEGERTYASRARLVLIGAAWRVAATEPGADSCA